MRGRLGWFLILLAADDAASEQPVDDGAALPQRHPSDRPVENDQPAPRGTIVRATAVRQEEQTGRRGCQTDENSHGLQYRSARNPNATDTIYRNRVKLARNGAGYVGAVAMGVHG